MDKALGTAAWLEPEAVIDSYEYEPGALWLGRSPTDDETPIGFRDDRHVCLVSGSRGGKGTSFIVNNLAHWPGSLVVIDPKGENATVTACRRGPGSKYCKGMGQHVYVLDPFNAAHVPAHLRARFNPLDALNAEREDSIDEAARIADALIVTNPESKDPFWDESARAMTRGLILHVLTAEEYEGRRNLPMIRDLITRGDIEKVELLKEMGEADIPSAHALLWEGVSRNPALGGIIARAGSSFASMLASSPKQYESVRQVVDRNTEFIDSPGMQRCLDSSDFRLSDLKTSPDGVSVYLSLPQRYMNTHFRWLRMMIALTITEMEATPGRSACGHRVLFCLDEFAGLKRMEVIENAVAQIAGFDVKLLFVLQTLEQLKGTYKDRWETFLSNCGLKVFFNLEDYFSREYVSKFIGEMEVVRSANSSSSTTGTQEGISYTTSENKGESFNEQRSTSINKSFTRSKGKSFSRSRGRSRGNSGGSNWGGNLGYNSSSGSNWKPQWLWGKEEERKNDSSGWSIGGNYGRNSGWNEGTNYSATDGWNTSESTTEGRTESLSEGRSFSHNVGTSESKSSSRTESSTKGTSESVHKRRLITEDEIGILFQRVTRKDHTAYPGLALVLAGGEQPIFLRKANYYEDPLFIDCYDPHPDHPFLPLVEHKPCLSGPPQELLQRLNKHASTLFYISAFHVEEGERISSKTPLFDVQGEAFGRPWKASICGGLNARVSELPAQSRFEKASKYLLTSEPLVRVTYYGDEQSLSNPYADLEQIVKEIDALAKRPVPVPKQELPPPIKPQPAYEANVPLMLAIAWAIFGFSWIMPTARADKMLSGYQAFWFTCQLGYSIVSGDPAMKQAKLDFVTILMILSPYTNLIFLLGSVLVMYKRFSPGKHAIVVGTCLLAIAINAVWFKYAPALQIGYAMWASSFIFLAISSFSAKKTSPK